MITPIIMAGGSGSRLWPLSRKLMPKQFLKISSDKTMIQETVLRLKGLDVSNPLCICNEDHRFIVAEQLQEIDALDKIILEPVGRNTAVALAALSILQQGNFTSEEGKWRFNLRSSNTEPVVRLNVESKGDIDLMDNKTKEILAILRA